MRMYWDTAISLLKSLILKLHKLASLKDCQSDIKNNKLKMKKL